MWFKELILGDFILAPRPSISIEKINLTPSILPGNCTDCGNSPIKNWEIIITMHFLGHGDLPAAINAFRRFQRYLIDNVCTNSIDPTILDMQYCTETPATYQVTKAYMQQTNFDWVPDCCDNTTISGELHLTAYETTEGLIPPVPTEPIVLLLKVLAP